MKDEAEAKRMGVVAMETGAGVVGRLVRELQHCQQQSFPRSVRRPRPSPSRPPALSKSLAGKSCGSCLLARLIANPRRVAAERARVQRRLAVEMPQPQPLVQLQFPLRL